MNVFDLFARLTLDSSEYEKGLGEAEKMATGGGSKIGSALGGAAKVAGVAVTAASTAITAFAKSSVDAGKEFDSSMSQVYATMGNVDDMGADSFNKLKEAAQEMGVAFDDTTTATELSREVLRAFAQEEGATTAFSATQAADALNYMALAGYDATTSIDMLPNVLNLAAAGGIDLASASDMVTDAQSALGLSIDETSELVDKMAKASSKTNTSVGQLGEAILTVGGTAKNLAGGTTELTQALGLLADNGIKGAEGGTALRNMILSLSAPTDKAAKLMKELGLEVFDAEGNMRPMNEIFADLNEILSTMTQEGQTNVLNDIFNKVDLKSANALLGTSAERWDQVASAINNAQGAAAQMADTQLDNLAGDVTLFQSALEGAKIAISDQLTPTLREFVQYGTQAVSELGTAFKEDGLAGALEALGPIIDQGVQMLFDVLPRILEAGVALVDALVTAVISNLPKLIPAALEIIKQIVTSISENAANLADSAIEIILTLADGLIEALPELIPAIVEIILAIVEKLTEPDTIVKLVEAAFKIMIAIAEGLIKAIPKVVEKIPVIIKNLINAVIESFPRFVSLGSELLSKFGEGIKKSLQGLLSIWKSLGESLSGTVKEWAATAVEWGKGLVTKMAEGITEKIDSLREAASSIVQVIKDIASEIWDTITGVVQAAKDWGSDMLQNFMGGVADKGAALLEKVKGVAQSIRDLIGFSEPKKGPLSNFHTFAPDMMELFAKGIKDNEDLVTAQISRSFNFEPQLRGAAPALAAGPTTNTYNITVNGIEELDEVLRWFQGRQVEARMV